MQDSTHLNNAHLSVLLGARKAKNMLFSLDWVLVSVKETAVTRRSRFLAPMLGIYLYIYAFCIKWGFRKG